MRGDKTAGSCWHNWTSALPGWTRRPSRPLTLYRSSACCCSRRETTHHRPGLCPDHRRCRSRFEHSNQVASYLRTDPVRAYFCRISADSDPSPSRATASSGCCWSKRRRVTRLDPQFHKHYVHLCRNKPKAVAKVAAARKLAIRRTGCYAPIRTPRKLVHIESSPRVPLVGAS